MGSLKAASPNLTLNGGSYREYYGKGLKLGSEIILNNPDDLGFWAPGLGTNIPDTSTGTWALVGWSAACLEFQGSYPASRRIV